jgi:UDP-GlcNAc:undecaprenyl-phosphate GlcNAc-1-phosphate transferase
MTAQAGLLVMFGLLVGSVILSAVFAAIVRRLALRWQVVDRPEVAPNRKLQTQSVPLLGGLAIWLTVVVATSVLLPYLTTGYLLPKHLIGLWLAGTVLMIGGVWDDVKNLSPKVQLLFPVAACIVVVACGIGVDYISNPLGGVIPLDNWQVIVWTRNGLPYQFTVVADLFTIGWLMLSMYTTKLLDGLDGLVSGVGMIGGVIIGLLCLTAGVMQPETAMLAFVFAGACAGFLLWNFAPARLYLGEGGALWIGFMLGALAIISGSKIATALLILGLPILDVLAVIVRRVFVERKSPFSGDLLHLHFQLQQRGWKPRTIVILYYLITLAFGLSTLLVTGLTKVIVLGILGLAGLSLVVYASRLPRRS